MTTADGRPAWTFLTSHARVLLVIADDPAVRIRDIAGSCGITERYVLQIVSDLEASGYLRRERIGRRTRYLLPASTPLVGPAQVELTAAVRLALLTTPLPPALPPASDSRAFQLGRDPGCAEFLAVGDVVVEGADRDAEHLGDGIQAVAGIGQQAEGPGAARRD
jgi:DNA-binding Lrp family transcriptional regulator